MKTWIKFGIPVALAAILLLALTGAVRAIPWASGESPWPEYQGGPQRRGQSTFAGIVVTPTLLWRLEPGYATRENPHGITMAGDGRTLYTNVGGTLHAVDLYTGRIVWTYLDPNPRHNNDSRSTPAVDREGNIYWGYHDKVVKLSPEGEVLWRVYGFSGAGVFGGSLAISPDQQTIYFINAGIFSISADGEPGWHHFFDTYNHSTPAVAEDGTIYAPHGNTLYAYNPDGTLLWSVFGLEGLMGSYEAYPSVGHDGTIYVASGYGRLWAIHPDGTLQWRFQADEDDWRQNKALHAPVVGQDGVIYMGVFIGLAEDVTHIYAINPDGTLRWKRALSRYANSILTIRGLTLDRDNRLYVCTDTGYCYAFAPDGTELWREHTAPEGVELRLYWNRTAPLIPEDGVMVTIGAMCDVITWVEPGRPVFQIDPPELAVPLLYGESPQSRWLALSSSHRAVTWTAEIPNQPAWFHVEALAGETPDELQLSITPQTLVTGTYTVDVHVQAWGEDVIFGDWNIPVVVHVGVQRAYLPLAGQNAAP